MVWLEKQSQLLCELNNTSAEDRVILCVMRKTVVAIICCAALSCFAN